MPPSQRPELVSVIIPTYRGDRFVADALSGIASQTWTKWEVIVVEDGSHGQTEKMVREFANEQSGHRVEYLRHPTNISQSAARNTGIAAARGSHIALLDIDDRWRPAHLAASMAALQQAKAALAYSTVDMFDDVTGKVLGSWGPTELDLAEFPFSLLKRSFISPSSVVFDRAIWDEVGEFDVPLKWCEDLDYWIRCASRGIRFVHVAGRHVLYRKNHTEAQTARTCQLTEAYARIVDRHQATLKNAPYNYRRIAAKAYFGAAWCHTTTSSEQDRTADPSRAPALFRRAAELQRLNLKYWLHSTLFNACERLQSNYLRGQFLRWLKPRRFMRQGVSPLLPASPVPIQIAH